MRDRAAEKLEDEPTPTFFINGKKYSGNPTAADISKQIDSYLKS